MHEKSNQTSQKENLPHITRWERFIGTLFIFFWLIPITYVGLFNKNISFAPGFLNNNYRIACLFTKYIDSWSLIYFQVQLNHKDTWYTIEESDYATMQPFGYRTRLKRYLSAHYTKKIDMALIQEQMSAFIKKRHEQLYPSKGTVTAVKIIQSYKYAGTSIAKPNTHWYKPKLTEISKENQYILNIINF